MPCYIVVSSIIPSTEYCPYRVLVWLSVCRAWSFSLLYYSKNYNSFPWSQLIHILHTRLLHSSPSSNFPYLSSSLWGNSRAVSNYIHMTWILSFFGVFSRSTNGSIIFEYRLTQIFTYNQISLFIWHNSLLSNGVFILICILMIWVSNISISLGMWLFQILIKIVHWLIPTIFYEFSIPKFQTLLYLSYKFFQSCLKARMINLSQQCWCQISVSVSIYWCDKIHDKATEGKKGSLCCLTLWWHSSWGRHGRGLTIVQKKYTRDRNVVSVVKKQTEMGLLA